MSESNDGTHLQGASAHTALHAHLSHGESITIDPVCGMRVDPAATPHHTRYAGRYYHFCSEQCRSRFIAAPESYLGY
ncbi:MULTISPECIES: YHS domain-containing protein [Sphingobium]|jgi:Cu+-exporting ATPase|uniref:YHS domain-containing protein n=1 Tax=Sphingobium fuliginis ATCC 27551 TaxID=1208342 RepID=A0A5B8CCG9_SPHSA|nr:YHS domain-containing protein [Sphingobium fuliginis ATCC 27551]